MRKLMLLVVGILACLIVAPATVHAVGMEVTAGAMYAPITEQDMDQLESGFGLYFVVGGRASDQIVTEMQGGYIRAGDVLGGNSQLYTIGLGAKYFFSRLYTLDENGVSTERFTRINPFFRTNLGVADGEIIGEDISTFISFVNGFGIRWDPTEASRDVAVDLDFRITTGTGAEGQAQTFVGVYLGVVGEMDFK